MKVINIFAGPGVGKSTLASELFAMMKKKQLKVEYVTEYAKDLVYGKDNFKLLDQLYIFAKQNHKLWRLERNQVDYVIVDSPLLFSLIYFSEDNGYNFENFKDMVLSVWNRYNNINLFIERGNYNYQQYGRIQNIEEAKELDEKIYNMLKDNTKDFKVFSNTPSLALDVYEHTVLSS